MVITEKEADLALINPARFVKITIEELNTLGYELTGRQLPMGGPSTGKCGIMEVKNEGEKKSTVSFCYLYSLDDATGVILDSPFNFYLKRSKNQKC